MRSTGRLFATVKSASKYLEANTPTGLTGLPTHPHPRSALIYNYRTTLNKLTQIPPSSVYRQSTEALTKQRLKIVEETIPEGFDAYLERVKAQIEATPLAYAKLKAPDGTFSYAAVAENRPPPWDGETSRLNALGEGVNTLTEADKKIKGTEEDIARKEREATEGVLPTVDDLETEPPLTAEQYVQYPAWRSCG